VQQPGEGELLGSRIGPRVRAIAAYPHNDIGITVRKVPRAIADRFEFRFSPAALIGFEKLLSAKALPVADDIRKKVAATSPPQTIISSGIESGLYTARKVRRRAGSRIAPPAAAQSG
jgi:hypothetical protein